MPLPPVIVTHWSNTYRLLEQALRRNKPLVKSAEWWLIYGRYPLLKAAEAVSDARAAQNLCKELGIDWWDAGEDTHPTKAFQKWSLEVGHAWPMDKPVCLLAQDAAPPDGFLDLMAKEGSGFDLYCLASADKTFAHYPGVSLMALREVYADRIQSPKAAFMPKKLGMDLGGPTSRGGTYPDSLYDPEWLQWSSEHTGKTFTQWLTSKPRI